MREPMTGKLFDSEDIEMPEMNLTQDELIMIIESRFKALCANPPEVEVLQNIVASFTPAAPKTCVEVTGYGEGKKIGFIKTIREFTGLGLAEAKEMSEQQMPLIIRLGFTGCRSQDHVAFAKALNAAGVTATAH